MWEVLKSCKEAFKPLTIDERIEVVALLQKRQKNRKEADRKWQLAQDIQACNMKKRYTEVAHVEVGEAVVLKVDERDRANHNTLGIQGIVAATARNGTSVQIVCMAGLLTSKNKPINYAPEDFGVLKTPTLPAKLRKIQDSIRKGTFDITLQPTTSVANAHRVLYGSESSGRGRCRCKSGCNKHCGCCRKNIPCSSSCHCSGNCANNCKQR